MCVYLPRVNCKGSVINVSLFVKWIFLPFFSFLFPWFQIFHYCFVHSMETTTTANNSLLLLCVKTKYIARVKWIHVFVWFAFDSVICDWYFCALTEFTFFSSFHFKFIWVFSALLFMNVHFLFTFIWFISLFFFERVQCFFIARWHTHTFHFVLCSCQLTHCILNIKTKQDKIKDRFI